MDILVNVINQRLKIATNQLDYVSGTQEFVRFTFNFLDSSWSGLTTLAQFSQGDKSYNTYLNSDNSVYLPAEIKAGKCTLMIYGTGGTIIGTSNSITLTINDSGFVSDASSTEITESLYQQLVDRVNEYTNAISSKVSKPKTSPNGRNGQILKTKGDGTTEWIDYNIDLKVNKPTTSPDGVGGQVLRTNGDGTTTWANVGTPTDAQTETAVTNWLNAHPEATTTVQDGSITVQKLHANVKQGIVAGVVGSTLVIGI